MQEQSSESLRPHTGHRTVAPYAFPRPRAPARHTLPRPLFAQIPPITSVAIIFGKHTGDGSVAIEPLTINVVLYKRNILEDLLCSARICTNSFLAFYQK
jgi:hypothetical protein